jgi:ArsR family transcriptional regulator, zinc-responsive transcriptional repressor
MIYLGRMNSTGTRGCEGIPLDQLVRQARMLKLLAHPHRLKILDILRGRGGLPVHELASRLGLPPAATSQLLNQMLRVGLLAAARAGREVRYRVADPRALRVLDCICKEGAAP